MTFSNAVDNYGQVLQYLATQEFLRSCGYDAALLFPRGHRKTRWRRFRSRIRKLIAIVRKRFCLAWRHAASGHAVDELIEKRRAEFKRWNESIERNEALHPRFFQSFKRRHFNVFCGTYEDILEHGFRWFCAGSDQIWSGGGAKKFLFSWAPDDCCRFSIAPSVGLWSFTDSQLAIYKRQLPKYRFVTVREDNGLELCRLCGVENARRVLDPSFLLSASAYDGFSEPVHTERPYVLIYMLGAEVAVDVGDVMRFCAAEGLEVKYVASQGREDSHEKIYPTVGEWLSLVRGAKYVFTNSFHGMAFSVIYRKPFLVFPLTGIMSEMNGRVNGLAKQMNLQDRIYADDISAVKREIDWSNADREIGDNLKTVTGLMELAR